MVLIIVIGKTAYIDQLKIIFSYLNKSIQASIVNNKIEIKANETENLFSKSYFLLEKTKIHKIIYNQTTKIKGHTKYKNQ